MLETIAMLLIVLWVVGMVSNITAGGFIHGLIFIAATLVIIRMVGRPKSMPSSLR